LGQDAGRQPDHDRHRAACGADPRAHHRADGAGREPARGRVARPARSAVEAHAMSLLEIEDLQLSIGPYPILRDVDLTLEAGEVLGIIGESGSGKSMTALSVMQLLPDGATLGGSIKLDGEEIVGRPERAMCRIRGRDVGMVFQEPMTALNPLMTIG